MTEIQMRTPCARCEHSTGFVEDRNGQDVVYCSNCGTYQYCRPKSESGRGVRSLRSRPDIKPSQRARVLERDNGTCVSCHRADGPMHVGHLLSVDDGRRLGVPEIDLFSDENLAAMCAECNLGQGSVTTSLRLVARVLQARAERARGGAA